jgi:DNA-binding NarL/FixJ family response regulator
MVIRVLVADDQAIIRTGLRMMLDAQPDIEVVGEAVDGRAAVRMARQLRPDVCLFDIRMPELDGLEATWQLAAPGVVDPLAVVVITTFDLDEYVYGALPAGARGFLLKDAGPELLVQAVRAAADGEALNAPSVTVRLLAAFADVPTGRPPAQPIAPLTAREEDVLLAVAQGLANAEIADALHISLNTVKTHLASLMAKLGARNRVEIAMWAYQTHRIARGLCPSAVQPGARFSQTAVSTSVVIRTPRWRALAPVGLLASMSLSFGSPHAGRPNRMIMLAYVAGKTLREEGCSRGQLDARPCQR